MLTIRNVSIGYPGSREILRNISLDVHPGEMLALIGKNGAGKTTLIRGLTGLLPLRSGSIEYNVILWPDYCRSVCGKLLKKDEMSGDWRDISDGAFIVVQGQFRVFFIYD